MDAFQVLQKHCDPTSELFGLLVTHSVLVTRKACELAGAYSARHPDVAVDLEFIVEAGLLHDVGIARCDAPEIHCTGSEPYIRHGVIGRELLEAEGLSRHALVCERHTGAGLTREEVLKGGLPLPDRDYMPISLEEKIICVADKFYSKSPGKLWREKSPAKIRKSLGKWGDAVVARWDALREDVLE